MFSCVQWKTAIECWKPTVLAGCVVDWWTTIPADSCCFVPSRYCGTFWRSLPITSCWRASLTTCCASGAPMLACGEIQILTVHFRIPMNNMVCCERVIEVEVHLAIHLFCRVFKNTQGVVYYSTGGRWGSFLLHRHTRGKSNIPLAEGRPVVIVFHSTSHSGEILTLTLWVLDSGHFADGVKEPTGCWWSKRHYHWRQLDWWREDCQNT